MLKGMKRAFFAFLLMALASLGVPSGVSWAEPAVQTQPRALVELYTAQGCYSCPRANQLLGDIARQPDILALTFPVGYWDYLGWSDTLARPEFSDRQRDYMRALGFRGLATPQFIFNGEHQVRGSASAQVQSMLETVRGEQHPERPRIAVTRATQTRANIEIGASRAPQAPADIWLAIYEAGPLVVRIRTGENAGQIVMHYNVVRRVSRIGTWNGATQRIEHQTCWPRCAVLVQAPNGGPILAFAAAPQPN